MKNVRTDKLKRDEMAQLVRDELLLYINNGARHWLNGKEPNLKMWDVVISDSEDLRDIHYAIDKNEVPRAFEKASRLDTAVRDVIPTKVWNWMAKVNAASK